MSDRSSIESQSPASRAARLPWCSFQADWPYEKVEAELTVLARREPTIFEWAVLRTLQEFPDGSPTLAEAVEELGIGDSVFLREALEGLLQLGAVELTASGQPVELANSRLTELGRRLLSEGGAPNLPEHHGLHLFFDPITSEHLARPPRHARRAPTVPVIDVSKLPERIGNIGLDRVRELARRQGEPFYQGESKIAAVTVHPEKGGHLWSPVQVALSIDDSGALQMGLDGGTEAQQAWFAQHGWGLSFFQQLGSASTRWANGRCQSRLPAVTASKWVTSVDRLVPPDATAKEAHTLIKASAQEVILHAGWLDAPEVENALAEAAGRGVRCCVCGAEVSMGHWSPRQEQAPGYVVAAGRTDTVRPLALVVDRQRGLRVDRVCARTSGGQELGIEVASIPKPAELAGLQKNLLAGVVGDLAGRDLQFTFAALALTDDLTFWETGLRQIEDQTAGIERVTRLRQWARWAQDLTAETEPAEGWFSHAAGAWWAVFRSGLSGSDGNDSPLIDAAVGLIVPAEVLAAMVGRIETAPALENPEPLCRLILLAGDIYRRWPEFNPIAGCPQFAQTVRKCLPQDPRGYHPAVQQTLDRLSQNQRFGTEGKVCVQVLSAGIPAPHDLASLLDWLEAHEPIKAYLGTTFQAAARQHLSRLQGEFRKNPAQRNAILARLQEAWEAAGLPRQDISRLLWPGGNRTNGQKTAFRNP